MTALHSLARLYVIFVAASGFLFGQIFTGFFSLPATLAGVCGIAAASLSKSPHRRTLVGGLCAASLVGVALDALHYYTQLAIPGNYYAWFLIGPYCLCLVFIAYAVQLQKRSNPPP
jgi:hypothetical protein